MARTALGVFRESGSALNLAVFRVVLFAYLAWFALTGYDWAWFAGLPDALRVTPPLAGWYAALPLTPEIVRVGQIALITSAIAAAIGWQTRVTTAISALLSVLVLGVPELYVKVDHYHHLVWFAAILAAGPCGDALSIDAWQRSLQRPAPSRAYALPLRYVWTLIGLIYFFPGLAKARMFSAWVHPDNLRFHLYAKWSEFDTFTPLIRLDQWPLGLSLAAASTIVFELTFVWLILHPRTRPLAAVGGLLFHQMTWQMMGISFLSLQVCYVAFVPWDRLFRWTAGLNPVPHRLRPITVVGSSLVVLASLAGLSSLNSWPFAGYPTFAYLAPPTVSRLAVIVSDASGRDIPVRDETLASVRGHLKDARFTRLAGRIATLPNGPARDRVSSGLLRLFQSADATLQEATRLEVRLEIERLYDY